MIFRRSRPASAAHFGVAIAPGRPSTLPRAALAADVAAAVLLLTGITAVFVDLPAVRLGGVRVLSVRDPWRLALLATLVIAARHWFVPHPRASAHLTRIAGGPLALDERSLAYTATWPRRLGAVLLLTGVFTAGVVVMTWPLARLDSVTDLGDPLFSTWRLAWIGHALTRRPVALFDTNFFYPERLTGTYSDAIIVPGLLAAPLLWVGVRPVAVYNLFALAGFIFSGVAMSVLVRALTGRRDAALVAGAVFALYPFRLEHLPQIELQMTMWMPLLLLGLHRSMAYGKWRDGVTTGVLFALQTLSSLYYGVFLAAYLIPLGGALWVGRGCPRRPLRAVAMGVFVAGALVAPIVVKYVETHSIVGERDVATATAYSADGADYLRPHDRSWLYGRWSAGAQAERHLFPTVTPVVLSAVALWPPLSVARIAYAVSLALAVDASLGFKGGIYPWLYEHVPPFRGLRVPARFGVLVGLTLAVLAGYGAARVLARWPQRTTVLTSAMLALVAFEAIPRLTLQPVWREPPPIYAHLAQIPRAVLAEFPMSSDETVPWFDARYVYFSIFHWHDLVNGYSGFFPPSYAKLTARERDFPSREALDFLRGRGVDYIAVHGTFYGPERYPTIVAQLDRAPGLQLVIAAPWEGSESRLYRLQR